MNTMKKFTAVVVTALTFSSNLVGNKFVGIGVDSIQHRGSFDPARLNDKAIESFASDMYRSTRQDAVVLGVFSAIVLGLGLHGYFQAESSIEHVKSITAEFQVIKEKLHALDVYNADYLEQAELVIEEVYQFNDIYKETIKDWYFYKSEHDIFSYGNMWSSEFMVEFQDFQKSTERLRNAPHAYAVEDARASLKALKKMAGEFYEGCQCVLSLQESGKFTNKIISGLSLAGLLASVYLYGTAQSAAS